MKAFLFLFLSVVSLYSCFYTPKVQMTDKYLKITAPDQYFGFVRLKDSLDDSFFIAPKDSFSFVNSKKFNYYVTPEIRYTLVNRKTHQNPFVNYNSEKFLFFRNKTIKIYFNKKYKKYCWAKSYQTTGKESHIEYTDTIGLEPYTWYQTGGKHFNEDLFFQWKGKDGNFVTKIKLNPERNW